MRDNVRMAFEVTVYAEEGVVCIEQPGPETASVRDELITLAPDQVELFIDWVRAAGNAAQTQRKDPIVDTERNG